jgi:hypothetical protein
MIEITEELRQQVEHSGGEPVRLTDPRSKVEYVVLRADVYERLRRVLEEVDPSLYEFEDAPQPYTSCAAFPSGTPR